MKNLMKFGLVMAMLFGMAVSAFANTTEFSLRAAGTKGKTVSFLLAQAKNVNVRVESAAGEVLFSETITSGADMKRTYDLSSFPNGRYILTADAETISSEFTIEVSNAEAKIINYDDAEVRKPMFVAKNDRVSVSIINKFETPIEITLIDANGDELYRETFAGISLVKMFSFEEVPSGKFTFVTRYSNRTFTDTITVGK